MRLLQLRYFLGVCNCGSAAKAAEALHISQSTISLSIKDLEQEFRLRLFIRTPRGMELTEEGRVLLRYAQRIVTDADEAEAELHAMGGSYGTIHVAIPPIASSSIWPELSGAVRRICPELSFKVTAFGQDTDYAKLDSGEINVVIRILHSANQMLEKYSYVRLSKAPTRVLCVSKKSPLARRKSVSYEEICELPLVQLTSDSQSRYLYDVYARFGRRPNYVESCDQVSTMIGIIQNGMAAGFLNDRMAKQYPGVIGIPVRDEKEVYYYLIWYRGWKERASVTRFIEIVKSLYPAPPEAKKTGPRPKIE